MKATSFLKECRQELEKVQWPTREEVVNSTMVVLATVIFFSIFLYTADKIIFAGFRWFWGLGT